MTNTAEDITDATAYHEAVHAVMRWIVGLPATEVTAGRDGGHCGGTGRSVSAEGKLWVALAGFAVEAGYGVAPPDLPKCAGSDFDRARDILAGHEWLRASGKRVLGVEAALQRAFSQAGELLLARVDLVENVAQRLMYERRLSARQVAAMCREYSRREAQAPTSPTRKVTKRRTR